MAFSGPALYDLTTCVSPERVCFLPAGINKNEALKQLAHCTAKHTAITDRDAFVTAIHERELVSSTGIGGGIAVPHAKLPSITDFVITVGICPSGMPFDAKDNKNVRLLVMIAASDQERENYLRVLATVAARLKNNQRCKQLVAASNASTVIRLLTIT